MKAKLIIVAVVVIGLLILGFWIYSDTQFGQKRISHVKSSVIGLDREIIIYSYDGKPIKSYRTRSTIERPGDGTQTFFKNNGKRVDVMGGIVIAEEAD